ncbi:MAG: aminoacyl-tRNA hydrolase [Thermodesulfobacteriota bacterium]
MYGKGIVIVGLGNPGRSYARHWHNIGFMVADALADRYLGAWTKDREGALSTRVEIEGRVVTLVKPQTFMNLSGKAVAPILRRVNGDPTLMIVVHDDLDLAPGRIRVKRGGGDGGHRGVRSIADSLRFRDFARLRIGIGRPPEGVGAEEFVLRPIPAEDASAVQSWVEKAVEAVQLIVDLGMDAAQQVIHANKPASKAT